DGAVYPMCPGTAAGSFDPDKHEFVNFTFSEVYADLRYVVRLLSRIRPHIRLIFTVSPVQLTATASGEHVLTATTYSKSLLRTVAGQIAKEYPSVDYFPSYEIVTAPVFRGASYADDMRAVTSSGAAFVMERFVSEFCDQSPMPARTAVRRRFTEET